MIAAARSTSTSTETIMIAFRETRRGLEWEVVVAGCGGWIAEGVATPSAELPIDTDIQTAVVG